MRFFCAWKPDQSNNVLRPMADLWHQLGKFAASGTSFACFSPQPFVTHRLRFTLDRVECSSNADLEAWGAKLASFDDACGSSLRAACKMLVSPSTEHAVIGSAFGAWLHAVAVAASCLPLASGDELSRRDSGKRAALYAAIGNEPQAVFARHDDLKAALAQCFAVMHRLTTKVLLVLKV